MDFKLVLDSGRIIAETPVWDDRIKKLYWTDLFSGDVRRWDPLGRRDEYFKTLDSPIGSAIPTGDPAKLLVALDRGIFLFDLAGGGLSPVADPEPGRPENCFNDTRVDPRGRIFTSTTAKIYGKPGYTPGMTGSFYMIDPPGEPRVLVRDIAHYNGMAWNGDQTRLFVVDSYGEKLLAFDYDLRHGVTGGPETALDLGDYGNPDGLSIDVEDNLYICHWTGKLSIWDRELRLKECITFPVPFVCCGGFGGDDMRDFYVATATWDYGPEEKKRYPGAGGIFMARNKIPGRPDYFYN